jgi:hypothetical protein
MEGERASMMTVNGRGARTTRSESERVLSGQGWSGRRQVRDEARNAWSGMVSRTVGDGDGDDGAPLADADCWLFPLPPGIGTGTGTVATAMHS